MQTVKKVWGEERILVSTELYCLKVLLITPGFQSSLHRHPIKDETFLVNGGEGFLILGNVRWEFREGDTMHIPSTVLHRFGSHGGCEILEVSTADDPDLVERLEPSGAIP